MKEGIYNLVLFLGLIIDWLDVIMTVDRAFIGMQSNSRLNLCIDVVESLLVISDWKALYWLVLTLGLSFSSLALAIRTCIGVSFGKTKLRNKSWFKKWSRIVLSKWLYLLAWMLARVMVALQVVDILNVTTDVALPFCFGLLPKRQMNVRC